MNRSREILIIEPITTNEQFSEVLDAAKSDNDSANMATHAVIKNGVPIGAFCVDSPTVYWWMHSKDSNVLDSMQAMASLEALARQKGHKALVFPVEKASPYHKVMNKWGYSESPGDWSIFTKVL